ncbi:unnamed protein product, partial [Rangifer tarandus platyrhynchus]
NSQPPKPQDSQESLCHPAPVSDPAPNRPPPPQSLGLRLERKKRGEEEKQERKGKGRRKREGKKADWRSTKNEGREAGEEANAVVQAREDSGFYWGGLSGSGKKWTNINMRSRE